MHLTFYHSREAKEKPENSRNLLTAIGPVHATKKSSNKKSNSSHVKYEIMLPTRAADGVLNVCLTTFIATYWCPRNQKGYAIPLPRASLVS